MTKQFDGFFAIRDGRRKLMFLKLFSWNYLVIISMYIPAFLQRVRNHQEYRHSDR